MNTLLENPLSIVAVGAMIATLAGLVFLSRRNLPSLFVFSIVVLLTLLLVVTERLVVTPREEVEQATASLIAAVEANDLPAVVALIDPQATTVVSDARTMMPQVEIEDAGATALVVDVDSQAVPPTATCHCRGRLRGVHRKTGGQVMFFDQVEFDWVRRDDRWLLVDFAVFWQGKSFDPANRLPGNRPAPVP